MLLANPRMQYAYAANIRRPPDLVVSISCTGGQSAAENQLSANKRLLLQLTDRTD
jgi:hypothetical protein